MKKGVESIEQAQSHKNEVELMKRIKHDNIILFYEHFDETISGSQYFCFVCEFCEVIFKLFIYLRFENI